MAVQPDRSGHGQGLALPVAAGVLLGPVLHLVQPLLGLGHREGVLRAVQPEVLEGDPKKKRNYWN